MTAVVTGRRLSPLRMKYAASGLIAPPVHPPEVALADAALRFCPATESSVTVLAVGQARLEGGAPRPARRRGEHHIRS
jgi:hypothetical protein